MVGGVDPDTEMDDSMRLPGHGSGGNEKPAARKFRPQSPQEFHARQDFPDRNRMQPNRPRTGLFIRAREESEALR